MLTILLLGCSLFSSHELFFVTLPVKITLLSEHLNHLAIVFVKRMYRKKEHNPLALQQYLGDILKLRLFSKLLII